MFRKITLFLLTAIIILLAVVGIKTITAPDLQRKITALPAPVLSDSTLLHFGQAIHSKINFL